MQGRVLPCWPHLFLSAFGLGAPLGCQRKEPPAPERLRLAPRSLARSVARSSSVAEAVSGRFPDPPNFCSLPPRRHTHTHTLQLDFVCWKVADLLWFLFGEEAAAAALWKSPRPRPSFLREEQRPKSPFARRGGGMEMPSAVAFCFPCRPQRQTPLFFLLGLLLSALSLRPGKSVIWSGAQLAPGRGKGAPRGRVDGGRKAVRVPASRPLRPPLSFALS